MCWAAALWALVQGFKSEIVHALQNITFVESIPPWNSRMFPRTFFSNDTGNPWQRMSQFKGQISSNLFIAFAYIISQHDGMGMP